MKTVAIIGGGISGLTAAHILKDHFHVTVFEKESTPGGLIRCKQTDGSLFHICGGHVFNTKKQHVWEWFWRHFDKDNDFISADRNSVVIMEDGCIIPYPIENHMYLFCDAIQKSFIHDLLLLSSKKTESSINFEDFLKNRFGITLYNLYFRPYNEKIWRRSLKDVPLDWLEGKLPMPTVEEMIYNNFNHIEEKLFVHSSFYYEKTGGSQFIADRLAEGVEVRYNCPIQSVHLSDNNKKIIVDGASYDYLLFCGNLKQLPMLFGGDMVSEYFSNRIEKLEYHGTTSVFCTIDPNPYSWIYQPSSRHNSHRIICTGNFSPNNNASGLVTGTVEFTDYVSIEDIREQLLEIPLHPKYIDHFFTPCSYPIQESTTRSWIQELKTVLRNNNIFFCGRFADWEYYNMDAAIDAAMKTCRHIIECDNNA